MKSLSAKTAQKLMNLYRNAHAVDGAWRTVNPALVNESTDEVLQHIRELPCGEMLAKHISNLKTGKTKADSIDANLLPYNGRIGAPMAGDIGQGDMTALKNLLAHFQPEPEYINKIKALPIVRRFGARWAAGVRSILGDANLIATWRNVVQSDRALTLWARAEDLLASTPTDLLRAEVQADMPEYETYLPMFGKQGLDALTRLRTLVIS